MSDVRIAMLCCYYPFVSHTFVQREVTGLRDAGVEVHTVSVRDAGADNVLSTADRDSYRTTEHLVPAPAGRLLQSHLEAFLHGPSAYASALRRAVVRAEPTARARLWQVFYFVEAVLLWRLCRRWDVRHVHTHFANNAADVARIVVDLGRAHDDRPWSWSFTMHGPTEFADVQRFGLPGKVRDADLVACISDYARSQLMGLVEEEHWDKLGIVHCGVDVDRFDLERGPAAPGQPLRVLCVGRLVPEKGHGVLLEAVGRLHADGVPVELTLVGGGPRAAALERRAAALGLGDRLRLTGPLGQDDILAEFARADAFALASFAEGKPVALMEAMAARMPVVTTRISGIAELVEDGVSGFVVTPGRADLLADALRTLADDSALREQMGQAGRSRVLAEYDARTTAHALVELLRDCPGAVPAGRAAR